MKKPSVPKVRKILYVITGLAVDLIERTRSLSEVGAQDNVLSFERTHESERIVVALNFGQNSCPLQIRGLLVSDTLLSTFMDRKG